MAAIRCALSAYNFDMQQLNDRAMQLSHNEMCQYLDLGPYLNPSYFVVQASKHFATIEALSSYGCQPSIWL
jgi:hypothetical protein